MVRAMLKVINFIVGLGLLISSIGAFAATHEPLKMDEGFQFTAKVRDSRTILTEWQMAPGYFLYRKHLQIGTNTPHVKLGKPLYPKGVIKNEPDFGSFEVYQNKVAIPVPVLNAKGHKITLKVSYQGCSEEGFCYPPTDKLVTLDLSKPDPNLSTAEPIGEELATTQTTSDLNEISSDTSEQEKVATILSSGHYFTIIASFLGFGILLAFTPCILPMVPILSGIIVGQNREKLTTSRAFSLSLTYVLSMSLTYAVAGVLIGYAGGSIQAAFQTPWLLITFSLIFVALALSFFGLYEIKFPERLQSLLSSASRRQQSGSYVGVAIMGCIATLIVSPCVTPALVGALGYIGKTGNALLGGIALFTLGFGMGIPLLLIGTAGGKFLPKAGVWMNRVKTIFGFILLAMAIWMLDRVLPGPVVLSCWAILLIFTAAFMGVFAPSPTSGFSRFNHGLAAIFLVYGVLLLIGSSMGHTNPLQPLYASSLATNPSIIAENSTNFKHVADENEVKNAIKEAVAQNKIVMLDFTAKWCTSCKIMDNHTFSNPEVVKALENFVALQADVTENDKIAKTLERKFQVVAPPTLLFFDSSGKELESLRVVGEIGPKEFLHHLETVLKAGQ
jgi:thioredoxin:protein disulfide reductase